MSVLSESKAMTLVVAELHARLNDRVHDACERRIGAGRFEGIRVQNLEETSRKNDVVLRIQTFALALCNSSLPSASISNIIHCPDKLRSPGTFERQVWTGSDFSEEFYDPI